MQLTKPFARSLITLYLLLPSAAFAVDSDAQRLFELSAMAEVNAAYFANADLGVLGGEDRVEGYLAQLNEATLENIAGLSFNDKQALIVWFDSPLGQRFRRAYAANDGLVDPNSAQLDVEPREARAQLLGQLVQEGQLLEQGLAMNSQLTKAFLFAMNPELDEDERISGEQLETLASEYSAEDLATYRAMIERKMAVMLIDFSDDELLQLTAAVGSEAYQRLQRGATEAVVDVFSLVFYERASALLEVVEEAKLQAELRASQRRGGSCPAPTDHGVSNEALLGQ